MLLLALAIAPGLAICLYVLYHDIYNREPAINMIMSFFWGVVAIVPAVVVETLLEHYFNRSFFSIILGAFVGVALVEEVSKFAALRLYSFTRRSFDEPLDGIVYSVLVSMGFATVENIFYVYKTDLSVAFLRMFTSVPAHATFAIIMGYYVGKAKFEHGRRTRLLWTGIGGATLAHGAYDAFLLLGENDWVKKYISELLLFSGAIASLYVAIRLSRKLIRLHHLTSQQLFHAEPVLTLRKASDEDILLIRELSVEVLPHTYAEILSEEQIRYMFNLMYSEAALHRQMHDKHQFIIIYNAGIPIGFASYSETDPTVYELHKIYILPVQQGRGTGSYVMGRIIRELRDGGATALQLRVNRDSKARDFYEKLGFEVVRTEEADIGNGFTLHDCIMEKKLSADLSLPEAPETE